MNRMPQTLLYIGVLRHVLLSG